MRSRISELESEITTRATEIRYLTERLDEWDRFPQSRNGDESASTYGRSVDKRTAITKVLGENPLREWKLSALYEELIARRWLERSEDSYHALQVYLSNMGKRGEVERPRKGFYRYKLPAFQAQRLEITED